MKLPAITQRDHSAILAGLRLLQARLSGGTHHLSEGALHMILTDDHSHQPLDFFDVAELCQRINK